MEAAVKEKGVSSSAAFIKELMRRAAQYYVQANCSGPLQLREVEGALEDRLFSGGSLNASLLGASGVTRDDPH